MAFYGKRRKPAGPSKNEQKVQRNEAEARRHSGNMSQRFPQVERLTISLQFLTPQGQILEEQKRVFKGSDAPDFSAPCPGRCGGGKFNLDAKVAGVVEARQPAAEATGLCQEPLYANSPDSCGARLQCKIEVSYLPEPAATEGDAPSAQ
jgi:hypothetical protein